MLLRPKKGTQGREMNRKIRIAPALALAGALFASVPAVASPVGPLLSGYGAPGAGEQAIIGSALLNGPRGGTGSGGSPSSGGSSGTSGGGSSEALSTGGSSASAGAAGRGRHVSRAGRGGGPQGASPGAYLYSSSPRSSSVDSPVLGFSGGDLMLLAGIIATLTLVGTLTIRLTRVQT